MKQIGVLGLQGAYAKHLAILQQLDVQAVDVRKSEDLEKCHGLIIPGGESAFTAQFSMLWVKLFILSVGYLTDADMERLTDFNFVGRMFIKVSVLAVCFPTDQGIKQSVSFEPQMKFASLNLRQVHTEGITICLIF